MLYNSTSFLNGVCRHEHDEAGSWLPFAFLNGVCRHELNWVADLIIELFLNGVCRHEHIKQREQAELFFSKWRMPP
ncbi:hypothetical protein F922_00987 [Acinetobacter baumannii NIPH 201]|nr:hypothetical protein F922_00987 [Acinetobacter baumannii NIPH 201]